MNAKITPLNQLKTELAASEKQLAGLKQESLMMSRDYKLRNWWLIGNIISLAIGLVIIAGGFYLERTNLQEYLVIALNTVLGAGVVVINANRLTTSMNLRRQQAVCAKQIAEIEQHIRVQEETITHHSN
jgi:hypothetical protein